MPKLPFEIEADMEKPDHAGGRKYDLKQLFNLDLLGCKLASDSAVDKLAPELRRSERSHIEAARLAALLEAVTALLTREISILRGRRIWP